MTTTQKINLKQDEQILVVPRNSFFNDTVWQGIETRNTDLYINRVEEHKQFIWRSAAEIDPAYKQIIPYLIFTHNNRYFVMERSANASEQRLKNKLTLGIGGHVRQEDMVNSSLIAWAHREFHEEVNYTGSFTVKNLGIINDDTDLVGQVHVGFALLLEGDSDNISIKSELKSGRMVTREELATLYDRLETWSQLAWDTITK